MLSDISNTALQIWRSTDCTPEYDQGKGGEGIDEMSVIDRKKERKTQGKEKSEHSADLRRLGRKVEKKSYKCVISISMFTFVSSFYVTSLHEYG